MAKPNNANTAAISKGQRKVYFITWPVQNAMGQLLLLSLSEVGQHIFEANINGPEALHELKVKFEMQIVSFWGQSCESCKKRNAWKDILKMT